MALTRQKKGGEEGQRIFVEAEAGIGCPRDKCKANIFATAASGSRERRGGGRGEGGARVAQRPRFFGC